MAKKIVAKKKLNTKFTISKEPTTGKKMVYQIRNLTGIPQAGDLMFEIEYTVDGDTYTSVSDGWDTTVQVDGKDVDYNDDKNAHPEITDRIIDDYAKQIGVPKSVFLKWLDLEGGYKFEKGDFINEPDEE